MAGEVGDLAPLFAKALLRLGRLQASLGKELKSVESFDRVLGTA